MPYKVETDKIKLGIYDRRRKLTEDQKEKIKVLYERGLGSHRSLARQFGVSKSCIAILVNPERAEKVKQRIKDHWQDYRQTKEEHAASMRKNRQYKHQLYKEGKLNEKI